VNQANLVTLCSIELLTRVNVDAPTVVVGARSQQTHPERIPNSGFLVLAACAAPTETVAPLE
jgi:hypothetical protein